MQSGVKLTDIERLIAQMYIDGIHNILCRQEQYKHVTNKLETPGRQITTNCFVRAYFEFEHMHMYAQHMSQISFLWLSADHTFKVSTNIGFWHRGTWTRQYDSLFCVLNEKGQVVTWQLTRGTSFEKVRSRLIQVIHLFLPLLKLQQPRDLESQLQRTK